MGTCRGSSFGGRLGTTALSLVKEVHEPNQRLLAVPIAARMEEALFSRRASRVCASGIAMLIARGIIGRSIKKSASNVQPATR